MALNFLNDAYFAATVGIGTNSPDALLEISGIRENQIRLTSRDITAAVDETIGGIEFYSSDSGNEGVKASIIAIAGDTAANAYMTFNTGVNTEQMRITKLGNVGIGTTAVTQPGFWYDATNKYLAISHWATPPTPAALLHLSDNANDIDVPQIRIEGRENPGDTKLDISVKDPDVRFNLIENTPDANAGYGLMIFKTNAVAQASFPTRGGFNFQTPASSSSLFITNGANVGIGTSSPGEKLEINTAAQSAIMLRARYNASYYTDYGSNQINFTGSNQSFGIKNNGSFAMFVNASSNVGINRTSLVEKFEVEGNIKITAALLSNQENTDIDSAAAEMVAQVSTTDYTAAFFDFVVKKGTNVRSGTVYACHDGTNVEFTETSTQDLGDTSDVVLSVDKTGNNLRLIATVTSDDWSVKSLIRAI